MSYQQDSNDDEFEQLRNKESITLKDFVCALGKYIVLPACAIGVTIYTIYSFGKSAGVASAAKN
jgi:hypothetical protein